MQPREKKLAIAVVALVVVVLLYVVGARIKGAFATRADTHTQLSDAEFAQNVQIAAGNAATAKRAKLEARSLPSEVEKARSIYQSWLLGISEASGLQAIEVRNITAPASKRVYATMPFKLTASATLPQLVKWLYAFYSAGHLHTIDRLGITPIAKSKLLELDIDVETIVLPGVKGITTPPVRTDHLALGGLDEYRKVIEARNLFGPKNNPPTLEATSRTTAKLGMPISYSARGKDPDPLDKLAYKLVGDAPKGATIDASTGRLSWTPPASLDPGEVKFQISATDDGLPPKTATQTLTIKLERIGLHLASISDQKIEPGKAFTTLPTLAEHDSKTTKTFAMTGDLPKDATFDAKSGQLQWTPTEDDIGRTLRLTLAVSDNATPPNHDERKFQVSVVAPKVPEFSLDFNAKHTYLTGVVEVDGQPEAWFLVRPTGESLKIPVPLDDSTVPFKAGNFSGRIVDITRESVTLEGSGRRFTVYLGKSLADAVALDTRP
jgi:hypothetical protein